MCLTAPSLSLPAYLQTLLLQHWVFPGEDLVRLDTLQALLSLIILGKTQWNEIKCQTQLLTRGGEHAIKRQPWLAVAESFILRLAF